MKVVTSIAVAGLTGFGAAAYAADPPADAPAAAAAPAAPTGPSLADVLTASGLAVTGYVSATYEHFSGVPTFRQFDVDRNSFSLNQAGVQIAYQPKEGFGGVLQLIAGNDAGIVNTAEGTGGSNFDVLQAYAQYVTGSWTIIGGKFLTAVGAEVIAPTGNTNISRSLTFYSEPLTHTGLRVTYAVNDQVSLFLGANNGWNIVHDNNNSKTVEFGASFTPNKMWSFAVQGYSGKEPTDAGVDGTRTIVDFVGTWNATDALTVILNYDFGRQENQLAGTVAKPATRSATWNTGALYVNYAINPTWRVSLRLEELNDKDGLYFLTGTSQKVKEGTITVGYDPSKNFELRLEGRFDKSDKSTFLDSNGTSFNDNQKSVALEALFKF